VLGIFGDRDSQFPEKMVRNPLPVEKLACNKFENFLAIIS
jgi:hypothetical protein